MDVFYPPSKTCFNANMGTWLLFWDRLEKTCEPILKCLQYWVNSKSQAMETYNWVCLCVISLLISHVIEECCEDAENSSGHTCEEEQLSVEETSTKPNDLPPSPLLFVLPCSGLWCSQGQNNGQGVCNRVDLHMDWKAIEHSCPQQTPACGKKGVQIL